MPRAGKTRAGEVGGWVCYAFLSFCGVVSRNCILQDGWWVEYEGHMPSHGTRKGFYCGMEVWDTKVI